LRICGLKLANQISCHLSDSFYASKKEIISMHQSHIKPEQKTAPYLDPMQLKQWFDEHKEMILLDPYFLLLLIK